MILEFENGVINTDHIQAITEVPWMPGMYEIKLTNATARTRLSKKQYKRIISLMCDEKNSKEGMKNEKTSNGSSERRFVNYIKRVCNLGKNQEKL